MVAKTEHHLNSGCPVACALDIFGDHWSLLIIRDLMFMGLHEYKELLGAGEGISSNILTDRLTRLQQAGIVASAPHPASRRRKFYYLTARGRDLIHVLLEISRWSGRHIPDKLLIPPEKRAMLVAPPGAVAAAVFAELDAWEAALLKKD